MWFYAQSLQNIETAYQLNPLNLSWFRPCLPPENMKVIGLVEDPIWLLSQC